MATRQPIKPIPKLTEKDIERFWSKVRKSDDPKACWEWTAGAVKAGYGIFWGGGLMLYAHRVALHLSQGNIPSDLLSLHHCDNPGCCNPAHLYVGTTSDNAIDRHKRGRARSIAGDDNPSRKHPECMLRGEDHPFRKNPGLAARGEKHGSKTKPWRVARGERQSQAKLKDHEVRSIRAMFATGGYTKAEIAKKYNVTLSNVWYIVSGKTWRHLL